MLSGSVTASKLVFIFDGFLQNFIVALRQLMKSHIRAGINSLGLVLFAAISIYSLFTSTACSI